MSAEVFHRVIAEWCDHTGMSPWSPDADMHVEIENALVGLIYDEAGAPDVLQVFVDLGAMYPDFYKRVLELNMSLDWHYAAFFALHSETGTLTYRACLPLEVETRGAELSARISELISAARTRLQA